MNNMNAVYATAVCLTVSLVTPCSANTTVSASEPGNFQATLTEIWTVYAIDVPELPKGEKYSRFTVICDDGSKLAAIPTVSNRWIVRIPPWATSGTVSTIVCGDGYCRPETYAWSTERSRFWDALFLGFAVIYVLGLLAWAYSRRNK